MRLIWTVPASEDLYGIARYIARENPAAARRVMRALREGCAGLVRLPMLGRVGRVEGTRELVFTPLPYIAIYRVANDRIEVLHVWHGAQDR